MGCGPSKSHAGSEAAAAPESLPTLLTSPDTCSLTEESITTRCCISSKSKLQEIIAGSWHTAFLTQGGSAWMVGSNRYGQLGNGTTIDESTPVRVLSGVRHVAVGVNHTIFVKKDGSAWAVGRNNIGQLGDGTYIDRSTPVKVLSDVKDAAAGYHHTIFIKKDGSAWGCGQNRYGQLGLPQDSGQKNSPTQVFSGVQSAACGYNHTMFLKMDGSAWGCGQNVQGQLGDGTYDNRAPPVEVKQNVVSVSAGKMHTVFLTDDSTAVWTTGSNVSGQLANGTKDITRTCDPIEIYIGEPDAEDNRYHVNWISAGWGSTYFSLGFGSIYAAGLHFWGYGNCPLYEHKTVHSWGYSIDGSKPVMIARDFSGGIRAVGGFNSTFFWKQDGSSAWGVGENYSGELGDGTTISTRQIVQVWGEEDNTETKSSKRPSTRHEVEPRESEACKEFENDQRA